MVDVHLDLREPHTHRLAVRLRLKPRVVTLRVRLPAWTPGSYLIRDYVRQLESLQVWQAGQQLPVRRLGIATWQVPIRPGVEVEVRYAVMATELTVRTAHLDQDHGFLPLAAIVLEVEGERWSPHALSIDLPEGWQAFLPLNRQADGRFLAPDFDALIDAPLEAGPHREQLFSVGEVPHRWVTWAGAGDGQAWLNERFPDLLKDVGAVAQACCRLMGMQRPASSDYLFVLHLLEEGYGGLEHDNASVLVYGRSALESPDGYRRFLQLVAHEYFHQWNVRRLRPRELAPIDYHRPQVVPGLWFAEGVTSYVDQLLPIAAGLFEPDTLWKDLGEDLSRFRLTPGRRVQSLRDSSMEAWVKLYRADAYAPDNQISYYLKGAVLALVLDLHLRRHDQSLASVLRDLWQRLGRWGRGYGDDDLIAAFRAAAPDLETLLPTWLSGLEDPDLDGYLADVGLRLQPEPGTEPWLGLAVRAEGTSLLAQRVHRGGPAETAGLMVGDELLGLEDRRLLKPEQLGLASRVGKEQRLLIARRGEIRQLSLRPEAPQPKRWLLIEDPEASAAVLRRRSQWLAFEPPQT
ncbi:MAG: M61 family metallopeptidase [Cyanobacteriota bacterium]